MLQWQLLDGPLVQRPARPVAAAPAETTHFYAKDCERAIRWTDPAIAITWPTGLQPRLAAKDAEAPLLADADTF